MSEFDLLAPGRPQTLAALAACGAAVLPDGVDGDLVVTRAAAIDRAGPDAISVIEDDTDPDDAAATRARACFVSAEAAAWLPPTAVPLVTGRPLDAFRNAVVALRVVAGRPRSVSGVSLDISARIDAEARVEQGAVIEPFVVLGPHVEIGAGTFVGAHCVIGAGVKIGRACRVEAHVTLQHALIGDRVSIQSGARIGCPGTEIGHRDVPLGRVIVQDDVVIGANAVVEQGLLHDTVLGDGARVGALAVVPAHALVERGARVAGAGFSSRAEMV